MNIIKSAIYIDFDNTATPLENDGMLVNVMAHFDKLIEILKTAGIKEEIYGYKNAMRLFAKKCVFYNPRAFGKYEIVFKENGFITVPCPVVTRFNKTSTDMWLAVEMIKDANMYEDYILISADVDFAPVLLHINSLGKRTIQLGLSMQNNIMKGAATVSLKYEDVLTADIFKPKSEVFDNTRDVNNTPIVKTVSLPNHPNPNQARIISRPEIKKDEKKEEKTSQEVGIFPKNFELDKEIGIVSLPKIDIRDKVLNLYIECKRNGVQKRFLTNTVLLRLQKTGIKKGTDVYETVLNFLRFIHQWYPDNISLDNLKACDIINHTVNNFIQSPNVLAKCQELGINPTSVKSYILKEGKSLVVE